MVATPPFNISTATPGDSDIVSQFPANERTNRDVINQWLLQEHAPGGYHNYVTMPVQGSAPTTPAAGFKRLYVDVNGNLVYLDNGGIIYYLGTPPGTVAYNAGGVPNGWVEANGQAISRTGTGAALFGLLGTLYGVGDGLTTFNVPNQNGRVAAGRDNGAGVLTTAGLSGVPANLGRSGGFETHSLVTAEIPAGVPSSANNGISVTSTVSTVVIAPGGVVDINVSTTTPNHRALAGSVASATTLTSTNNAQAIAVNSTNSGQTAVKLIQPTIVYIAVIKL